LMLLGKVTTGLWLLQLHVPASISAPLLGSMSLPSLRCWGSRSASRPKLNVTKLKKSKELRADNSGVASESESRPEGISQNEAADTPLQKRRIVLPKPHSLYPASPLGSTMLSRSELSSPLFQNKASGIVADSAELILKKFALVREGCCIRIDGDEARYGGAVQSGLWCLKREWNCQLLNINALDILQLHDYYLVSSLWLLLSMLICQDSRG